MDKFVLDDEGLIERTLEDGDDDRGTGGGYADLVASYNQSWLDRSPHSMGKQSQGQWKEEQASSSRGGNAIPGSGDGYV